MDPIIRIAEKNGSYVEDVARVGAKFKGKAAGTFGLASVSFSQQRLWLSGMALWLVTEPPENLLIHDHGDVKMVS